MNTKTRPTIQRASRGILLGFVMLLMVTQFTNCGEYAPVDMTDGASSVACTNNKCVNVIADNMKITPHLGNGEYDVTANMSEFNLGGDCNEGGFANNYIHWDLINNSGTIVRHSGMQIAQGLTAESKCVNGRFLIYVILSPITLNNADPYDRTGLALPSGGRAAYNLNLTIYGSDPETGTQGQFQTTIPLVAY